MTAHPQPGARRYIENRTIPWINQEVREVSTIHLTNCGDELPSLTVLPTILHDPALQVYRLPGWRWQLDPGSILEHPSDLLKVLPCTLAGSSRGFELRLAGTGAFSEGLAQIARAPDESRGLFWRDQAPRCKSSDSAKLVFTGFGSCAKFQFAPAPHRLRSSVRALEQRIQPLPTRLPDGATSLR